MNPTTIKEKVLAEIRAGRIHQHSRLYFIARLSVLALATIVAIIVAIFLVSFIVFSIHESGEFLLFNFGARGIGSLALVFPWTLLIIIAGLTLAAEYFLRRFKFGYRIPVLRIFFALVFGILCVALLLLATPLHRTLLDKADRDDLPFMRSMYRGIHVTHREHGLVHGVVVSIATSTIWVRHDDRDHDSDDQLWTIVLPNIQTEELHVGDTVFVAGVATGTTIEAFGIRKVTRHR